MHRSALQAMVRRRPRALTVAIGFALLLVMLNGCSRFHPTDSAEYVYVAVKQVYLRDRVAVIANRVAQVTNGERLRVLERGRHFIRVQTPQGSDGWIEVHAVIDQGEYNRFQALAKAQASQPSVATAVLYSELYIHLQPGRKTHRFYLFPANSKVMLLERASVPRNPTNAMPGALAPTLATTKGVAASHSTKLVKGVKESFGRQFAPNVPMEDWWLVRDGSGRTGWMLSRDLQVDVPEDVAQYAENEKMVGAYVLRTVSDPDSGKPHGQVPEYLTVLTPYKDGLPFDFDQVRVFTWDTRRHRYGTAFRQRDVAGFFPVTTKPGQPDAPGAPAPEFSFQRAVDNAVSLDSATGIPHAVNLETITYRLEGNLVRRVSPVSGQPASSETAGNGSHPFHRARHRRHVHR